MDDLKTLSEVTKEEVENALKQLKNGKAPNENGTTKEMITVEGQTTLKALIILLNKCQFECTIPTSRHNVKVTIIHKKEDKNSRKNYRPRSLLTHPYKLLTKIITNILANKLESFEPSDQAGFRIEDLRTLSILIGKCEEFNEPLDLAFAEYNNVLD